MPIGPAPVTRTVRGAQAARWPIFSMWSQALATTVAGSSRTPWMPSAGSTATRYSGWMRNISLAYPCLALIPRSVYRPFVHMSQSPAAQAEQGTGSRRRTMPTTRSPAAKPVPCAAATTSPTDSCPMIRRSSPGGAQPYSPLMISRSVPHTPIACVRTRTGPSCSGGSGMSARATEPGAPGTTVIARMVSGGSGRENLGLRLLEFLVGQDALVVQAGQLGELVGLARPVGSRRILHVCAELLVPCLGIAGLPVTHRVAARDEVDEDADKR